MVAIRDSNINALTIGRRAPLDTSERSARPHRCAPNDVAVIGIECPEDAALLPKPTMLPTRLGPDPPKSKSGLVGTGQFAFGPVGVMQATVQVSKPCSLVAHLICPVFKSSANAVSKKSSAAVQFASGVAFWHAYTSAGAV